MLLKKIFSPNELQSWNELEFRFLFKLLHFVKGFGDPGTTHQVHFSGTFRRSPMSTSLFTNGVVPKGVRKRYLDTIGLLVYSSFRHKISIGEDNPTVLVGGRRDEKVTVIYLKVFNWRKIFM